MAINKNVSSFNPMNDDQSTKYLATTLPKGRFTANRFNVKSIFYKLLYCLADFVKLFTTQLFSFVQNVNINQADVLLPEWETSVGIPNNTPSVLNSVINLTGVTPDTDTSNALRRTAVKQLISKTPVYNTTHDPTDDITLEKYVKNLTNIDITMSFDVNTNHFIVNALIPSAIGDPGTSTFSGNPFAITFTNWSPGPGYISFYLPISESIAVQYLSKVLDKIVPSYMTYTISV
jgi:hypothetical protein